MIVSLYYVIPEMDSFPMSVVNNFCDKLLSKYLDSKTVLIYCPHPVDEKGLPGEDGRADLWQTGGWHNLFTWEGGAGQGGHHLCHRPVLHPTYWILGPLRMIMLCFMFMGLERLVVTITIHAFTIYQTRGA
jgi:hypothetical protein